jgi:hypothetical protein
MLLANKHMKDVRAYAYYSSTNKVLWRSKSAGVRFYMMVLLSSIAGNLVHRSSWTLLRSSGMSRQE